MVTPVARDYEQPAEKTTVAVVPIKVYEMDRGHMLAFCTPLAKVDVSSGDRAEEYEIMTAGFSMGLAVFCKGHTFVIDVGAKIEEIIEAIERHREAMARKENADGPHA